MDCPESGNMDIDRRSTNAFRWWGTSRKLHEFKNENQNHNTFLNGVFEVLQKQNNLAKAVQEVNQYLSKSRNPSSAPRTLYDRPYSIVCNVCFFLKLAKFEFLCEL